MVGEDDEALIVVDARGELGSTGVDSSAYDIVREHRGAASSGEQRAGERGYKSGTRGFVGSNQPRPHTVSGMGWP